MAEPLHPGDWNKPPVMNAFEKFCGEYGLEYKFARLGNNQYWDKNTQQAFIIFKYSERQKNLDHKGE